jgi:hypothetical protein
LRKYFSLVFILLLAGSLNAQVRTGNIFGTIVDEEGQPLPGVNVTLTGALTAPLSSVSSVKGLVRFLSLAPAQDYALRAELAGFKTAIQEGIIVAVDANVNITLALTIGVISEEVTVTAENPVVDTKKVSLGMNITQEILQSIPTARDPWVLLQLAPAVTIDRENIGGNESGHQSLFVSKGASGRNNNAYSMDGVDISNANSSGSSIVYYDVDAYEEMNITVGGADVTNRTGGVALNMVSKRGGNNVSIGGRFYLTDKKFQADNLSQELIDEGVAGINQIRRNRDYGVNVGFPFLRDKAWFWGSFGEQDIKTTTIFGNNDDTTLTNVTAKLNLQLIPQNRFEALVSGHEKYKYGGGQSSSNPEGIIQQSPYAFGTPMLKFQDEHMFGDNFFISAKYAYMDSSGGHVVVMDQKRENLALWDVTDQRYYDSFSSWNANSLNHMATLTANYFNDSLFGASHDIKVGIDFQHHSQEPDNRGTFSGNILVRRNYNSPTVDFDGDGSPDVPNDPNFKRFEMERSKNSLYGTDQFAAFLSDTITFGRINLILGLRFDRQTPYMDTYDIVAVAKEHPAWTNNVNANTINLLDGVFPAISVPAVETLAADGSSYNWTTWSPRLGVTWDVTGSGKTLVKMSLASYGDYMGTGEASSWKKGGTGGWMDFWWLDNGDNMLDSSELYWHTIGTYAPYRVFTDSGSFVGDYANAAGTFWGGYDYQNPNSTTDPYTIKDANAGSSRTLEAILTFEKELLPDLSVQINGTYRRYDNFRWWLKYFPDTGVLQNQDWYISAGTPPANIPGIGDTKDAQSHEWYYQSTEATQYSPWTAVKPQPDAYNDYMGLDLVATKRLSNRWMLNASFTIQTQAQHFGNKGYNDPTNLWAYEGEVYSPFFGGGSGKINAYIYTQWMLKVSGLYQLPYGFNLSGSLLARPGYIQREYFRLIDYSLPNPKSNSANLEMTAFGSQHLPSSFLMNLRLEKLLTLGDTGKIYLMADAFNLLNSATINRRELNYHGTYYVYADTSQNRFVPNINNDKINEILNPRVIRFGVRFQF